MELYLEQMQSMNQEIKVKVVYLLLLIIMKLLEEEFSILATVFIDIEFIIDTAVIIKITDHIVYSF